MAQRYTYSGNIYDASAEGTTTFSLTSTAGNPIGYLQRAHIHVYLSEDDGATWLEQARPSAWDFDAQGTSVVLKAGITSGQWVRVLRITPLENAFINFANGSLLTADQLDAAEDYSRYCDQDLADGVYTPDPVFEAPDDGVLYGRQSKSWQPVPEYQLPTASSVQLGGIKVGNNLSISNSGVLSATSGSSSTTITYKGLADFTSSAPPGGVGDLYINTTQGTGAWDGFDGDTVGINDRAFFNGSDWDLLPIGGGGGVPVTSVNNKTGDVVLTAADVGAATAAQGAKADSAVQSVNGKSGNVITLAASDVDALPAATPLDFVPLGSWSDIPSL